MIRSGFKRKVYERPPVSEARPVTRGVHARCTDAAASQPKHPRAENRHLLDMAKGQPCLIRSPICVGGTETTVACHGSGLANGKGGAYKVGDHLTAWGCYRCNEYTDAYKNATKDLKEAAFIAGHLRQVLEWRLIAAGPASKDQKAAQWALDQLNATKTIPNWGDL